MFTANDFHTAFIQLMQRAGRGERVDTELDNLIVRLEQTKTSQSLSDWQQSVASIRGSFMTHFGAPSISGDVTVHATDNPELRKGYFVEAVISRLAHLMEQAA